MKRVTPLLVFSLFVLLPPSIPAQSTAEMEDIVEMAAPPGTVVSISPAACIPAYQNYYDHHTFYTNPDEAYFEYAFMVEFKVPVNIPHGATVTKMVVYFTDNAHFSDEEYIDVYLNRHRMATGDTFTMARVDSEMLAPSPERRAIRDRSIDYAIVDNQFFSYHLRILFWQSDEDLKFHGAKIFYTMNP